MRPRFFAAFAITGSLALVSPAMGADMPSGESLLQHYIDLTGGAQAWAKAKDVARIGVVEMPAQNISGTVSIPTITDTGTGTSKPAIDSHVIGCLVSGTTTACNSTQTSFVDNTQPVFTPSGGSSFTSVRMATGATCAQVRQALQ